MDFLPGDPKWCDCKCRRNLLYTTQGALFFSAFVIKSTELGAQSELLLVLVKFLIGLELSSLGHILQQQ